MTFTVCSFHCNRSYDYAITTTDWETFHCKRLPSTHYQDIPPPETFTLKKGEKYTDNFAALKRGLMEGIQDFFSRYGTVVLYRLIK